MDKLKIYLREHRAALDVEMPPADLWQQIQAGAAAQAAKAMLIKYIVGIGVAAVVGAGVWMMSHQQQTMPIPEPVTPPKEVILKDTVPDTPAQQPVPAIKHKKKKAQRPPAPVAVRKHKKAPAPAVQPVPPRKKKKAVTPPASSSNTFPAPASTVPIE